MAVARGERATANGQQEGLVPVPKHIVVSPIWCPDDTRQLWERAAMFRPVEVLPLVRVVK